MTVFEKLSLLQHISQWGFTKRWEFSSGPAQDIIGKEDRKLNFTDYLASTCFIFVPVLSWANLRIAQGGRYSYLSFAVQNIEARETPFLAHGHKTNIVEMNSRSFDSQFWQPQLSSLLWMSSLMPKVFMDFFPVLSTLSDLSFSQTITVWHSKKTVPSAIPISDLSVKKLDPKLHIYPLTSGVTLASHFTFLSLSFVTSK